MRKKDDSKKIDEFDYGFHFPFCEAVHKSRVMTLDLFNVFVCIILLVTNRKSNKTMVDPKWQVKF